MPRPKPLLPPRKSRLSGIYHRLTFLLGLGISIWIVLGYMGTKMRQARIKLVADRERSERVKQHFTSTVSNITFTIYALIPTLSAQILAHLDVEGNTEELTTLAHSSSSSSSSAVETRRKPATANKGVGFSLPTLGSEMTSQGSSTMLESDFMGPGVGRVGGDQTGGQQGKREIGESWASEFVSATSRRVGLDVDRHEEGGRSGSSTDDLGFSEDGREGQGGSYHHDHDHHHHHHHHDQEPNEPHVHPFSTPASHSYALQSDMETSTDMSTSISNMTDPSLRSSSSEHDDQEETTTTTATTSTGERLDRSRSIGRAGHNDRHREKMGDEGFLSSPEGRYLRSPSQSPRRSRSSGHPAREHTGGMSQKQGDEGGERQEQVGFSYADIVKVGTSAEQTVDEGLREVGAVGKGAMGQGVSGRTKAQLWNGIKVQSITRTILTIYLVPLLAIHTTSQLTLLARLHHLRNLAELHSSSDNNSIETLDESPTRSASRPLLRRSVLGKAVGEIGQLLKPWNYFSLESMGLDEYVGPEKSSSSLEGGLAAGVVSGLWSVGTSTASYFLGTGFKRAQSTPSSHKRKGSDPLHMRLDLDTERTFLCFSWWLLHVGWKELEERVRPAVKLVFKSVTLKKELSVQDWSRLFDEIKNTVDQSLRKDDGTTVNGLHDLMFPPADPARFESLLIKHGVQNSCPIPAPPYASPLAELLDQTSSHVLSADCEYLLSISIGKMKTTVLDQLASQIYDEIVLLDPADSLSHDHARIESLKGKRLVECLPFLTTWSRGVWAKVPDEAIERTLGLSEMEAFASLIYADFGNDLVQDAS